MSTKFSVQFALPIIIIVGIVGLIFYMKFKQGGMM